MITFWVLGRLEDDAASAGGTGVWDAGSGLRMARLVVPLTALALLAAIPQSAYGQEPNLLRNPGFEQVPGVSAQATQGLLPSEWSSNLGDMGADTYSAVPVGHGGFYGLHPDNLYPGEHYNHFTDARAAEGVRFVAMSGTHSETIFQSLGEPLVAGRHYEVRGHLRRSTAPLTGGMNVYLTTAPDDLPPEYRVGTLSAPVLPVGDADWEMRTMVFRAPANAEALGWIVFRPEAAAQYLALDNFSLAPLPAIRVEEVSAEGDTELANGDTVSFGAVPFGTPAVRKTLRITNSIPDSLLPLSSIRIDGARWSEFSLGETPQSLPGGESCLVNLTYKGPFAGPASARLVIESNDARDGVFTINLRATAPDAESHRWLNYAAHLEDFAYGLETGPRDRLASALRWPCGVAASADGTVFVADTYNNGIALIDAGGTLVRWVGMHGSGPANIGQRGAADGTGSEAGFWFPRQLAILPDGGLVVADSNNHTIRKVTAGGAVSTLAGLAGAQGFQDGPAVQAAFSNPSGVAVDDAGNIYVADTGNHAIRLISSAGQVSTVAGEAGTAGYADGSAAAARFDRPTNLAIDPLGNLYVTDFGNHRIRKLTPAGTVETVAGSGERGAADGAGASATFDGPCGLAYDGALRALIVTDYFSHTVRKVSDAGETTTIAGMAGVGGNQTGDGGSARFNYPSGVAAIGGILFVADMGYNRIVVAVPKGGNRPEIGVSEPVGANIDSGERLDFGKVVAGSERRITFAIRNEGAVDLVIDGITLENGNSDGFRLEAGQFSGVIAPGGSVPVTVLCSPAEGVPCDAVVRISSNDPVDWPDAGSESPFVIHLAAVGTRPRPGAFEWRTYAGPPPGLPQGYTLPLTALPEIRFRLPSGIATAARFHANFGNPYSECVLRVTDSGNHAVSEVGEDFAGRLAGFDPPEANGPGAPGSGDGAGATAGFRAPRAIASLSNTEAVVADTGNHTIRKTTAEGTVTTIAGSPGMPGHADGNAQAARFRSPAGIAAAPDGTVFVADTGNHVIRSISPLGEVSTIAGAPGQSGYRDGPAASALFSSPSGIDLDPAGNLYIADTGNHRLRIRTVAGTVTTLAGSGADASVDGTGPQAGFSSPSDLTFETAFESGMVYVAESGSHTIRQVTPDGVTTTVGGLAGVPGTASGMDSNTRFRGPLGIASRAGVIYVADTDNNRIVAGYPASPRLALSDQNEEPLEHHSMVMPPVAVAVNGYTEISLTLENPGASPLKVHQAMIGNDLGGSFEIVGSPGGTIPAFGKTKVVIRFQPAAAGAHSADLTLFTSDSSRPSFVIRLAANALRPAEAFAGWASSGGAPPLQSAALDIPHADGIPNLLKYAFRMNPAVADRKILAAEGLEGGLPRVTLEPPSADKPFRTLEVQFLKRKASGLIYFPKVSYDLVNYAPLTEMPVVKAVDAEWERVSIRRMFASPSAFVTVEVQLP